MTRLVRGHSSNSVNLLPGTSTSNHPKSPHFTTYHPISSHKSPFRTPTPRTHLHPPRTPFGPHSDLPWTPLDHPRTKCWLSTTCGNVHNMWNFPRFVELSTTCGNVHKMRNCPEHVELFTKCGIVSSSPWSFPPHIVPLTIYVVVKDLKTCF